MKNIYELRSLTHKYGSHATLGIKSLDIPKGVVGLVGPNGSGKSTLLKILAFLLPYEGKMSYCGRETADKEREMRKSVTLLLQEPYLLRRSVFENVAYGLTLRGCSRGETEARVSDSLARVGLPFGEFAHRPWYRLSGGEAQRVSLASRLALRPEVLLLDEPTANVDELSAAKIKDSITKAARDWGSTVIAATHDLVWLYEAATDIVSLYEGRAAGGAANLIPGPWKIDETDGRFATTGWGCKFLANVASGAEDMTCAAVSPGDITIRPADDEGIAATGKGFNRARGVITQMSIEKLSGGIVAAVNCGGLTFRTRLTRGTIAEYGLCPGVEVDAFFPVSSVKFI
ncbi:MAG: energy-coupling factor ABC transporter ATP-binding protein [Synergistaceae bacterium]|nr:energy-coupling factor ABC transporter ATP-binding protein [Synergistaceae bacterium]